MNNKLKIVLMYASAVVLIVLFVILLIAFKNKKQKEENKLYNTMNTVVKEFYRDYYYPYILGDDNESRVEKTKSYKSSGITMSLNDLAKYKIGNEDSILSLFKNYRTGSNCNYDKTKITIYPVEPYGSEDIRIEANIVCGF